MDHLISFEYFERMSFSASSKSIFAMIWSNYSASTLEVLL